jgi:hypothetical protein
MIGASTPCARLIEDFAGRFEAVSDMKPRMDILFQFNRGRRNTQTPPAEILHERQVAFV